MKDNILCSKAIYLSIQELLILLYKKQVIGLSFPNEITEAGADSRQLKEAMGGLISSKYLEPGNNDLFKLSKETEDMMEILGKTSGTTIVCPQAAPEAKQYFYASDNAVLLLQMDKNKKGWIRMQLISTDEAISCLTEYNMPLIIERYKRGKADCERTVHETVNKNDASKILREYGE